MRIHKKEPCNSHPFWIVSVGKASIPAYSEADIMLIEYGLKEAARIGVEDARNQIMQALGFSDFGGEPQ